MAKNLSPRTPITQISTSRRSRIASPIRAALWKWKWVGIIIVLATMTQSIIDIARTQHPNQTKIVVATQALNIGDTIKQEDLKLRAFPQQIVPNDSYTQKETVVGKTLSASLPAGLPITSKQIMSKKFTKNIPAGMSVTTIILEKQTAKILQIGNKINLYTKGPMQNDNTTEAYLLAENAIVINKDKPTKDTLFAGNTDTINVLIAIPHTQIPALLNASNKPLQAVLAP